MCTPALSQNALIGKRNGQIELFRIIFAFVVVCSHIDHVLPRGSRVVEFFFLVSGYLMMQSISRLPSAESLSLPQLLRETQLFVCRKVKGFYVELTLALLIGVAFYVGIEHDSLMKVVNVFLKTFFSDFCLLKETGILDLNDRVNGPVWYLSSMVLAMLFLYPLIRKIGVNLTLFAIFACMIGFCYACTECLNNPYAVLGFTLKGNLRAFAEMGLGACAYPLARSLAILPLRMWVRCGFSLFTWSSLALLLFLTRQADIPVDYLFVYLTWLVLIIVFSGQCIESNFYQNPLCMWLGRLSLPLYLSHRFYTLHIAKVLSAEADFRLYVAAVFMASLPTALVVMYGAEYIRSRATNGAFLRMVLRAKQ